MQWDFRFPRVVAIVATCVVGSANSQPPLVCPADWSGSGMGTWYESADMACGLDVGDGLTVALSSMVFAGSAHCSECLDVTGPLGHVVVRVADVCVGCASDQLDLSASAFSAIANPLDGIVPVSWRRVACPVAGTIAFRFQGSNPYYIKLQASNHRYGVAGMELLDESTQAFVPMTRTADNYFQINPPHPASSNGPITVRLTATSAESVSQTLPDITQSGTIPGAVQFDDCSLIFRNGFE